MQKSDSYESDIKDRIKLPDNVIFKDGRFVDCLALPRRRREAGCDLSCREGRGVELVSLGSRLVFELGKLWNFVGAIKLGQGFPRLHVNVLQASAGIGFCAFKI